MDGIALATLGAALAAPARARMVEALLGGRALSATELALYAEVTPQTASTHLQQLVRAGIVCRECEGRHRFYGLAGPEVADALEALQELATVRSIARPGDASAFRWARTCYDHLAGRLGVALTDSLRRQGHLRAHGMDFELTRGGRSFLESMGISLDEVRHSRRLFARQCIDRTERIPHLGGALGAALAARCFELGWVSRIPGGRAVRVTPAGEGALHSRFGSLRQSSPRRAPEATSRAPRGSST